jgi:hypothetical protein
MKGPACPRKRWSKKHSLALNNALSLVLIIPPPCNNETSKCAYSRSILWETKETCQHHLHLILLSDNDTACTFQTNCCIHFILFFPFITTPQSFCRCNSRTSCTYLRLQLQMQKEQKKWIKKLKAGSYAIFKNDQSD